jgi:prepilin-type N-terminal cleavage/methylation domain-containing protein
MTRARRNPGFTLVEIMVALALLGMTVVVLLDAHYGAMRLFTDTRDEALMQQFLESALAQAELAVTAGTLTGSGQFGKRHEGYSFTFSATPFGETEGVPLYMLTVMVNAPNENENRSMMMLVYNTGQ